MTLFRSISIMIWIYLVMVCFFLFVLEDFDDIQWLDSKRNRIIASALWPLLFLFVMVAAPVLVLIKLIRDN